MLKLIFKIHGGLRVAANSIEAPATIEVKGEKYSVRQLYSEEEVQQRVRDLAYRLGEVVAKLENPNPLGLIVAQGGIHFGSDLLRSVYKQSGIDIPYKVVTMSSYGGRRSSGIVRYEGPEPDVSGRDVILIEDILDTGLSLGSLVRRIKGPEDRPPELRPASVAIAVAAIKDTPDRHPDVLDDTPIYHALDLPNDFVVGYGLDWDQQGRNIPYIGVAEPIE